MVCDSFDNTTGMLLSIVRDVALDDGEMCRVSNARECRG